MNQTLPRFLVVLALALVLSPPTAVRAAAAPDPLADAEKELDRADDLYESGSEDLASSMIDGAVKRLEAAAKKDPKSARAQALLARAYAGRGDAERADAAAARAAALAPDNADYQFQHGLALARAERTVEAMAAFRRAAQSDPKHARATLMVGAMHATAGDEDAALEWFAKAAKIDPKYASAHGNAGQIHQNRGELEAALAAFERAVEAAPQDWRFRAKLVQLYQALGRTEDRDRERAAIVGMWEDDKVDSPHYCREQFEAAGKRVQAYEHFELEGERAVRYAFVVLKPDGASAEYEITLGSYDLTTEIAREQGEIGKDERMFHLDGYYPRGEHRTFGMFKKEPTCEQTRARVIEVLKGERKAKSGSKRKPDGDVDVELEAGE